jgi:hypothetical protein
LAAAVLATTGVGSRKYDSAGIRIKPPSMFPTKDDTALVLGRRLAITSCDAG